MRQLYFRSIYIGKHRYQNLILTCSKKYFLFWFETFKLTILIKAAVTMTTVIFNSNRMVLLN